MSASLYFDKSTEPDLEQFLSDLEDTRVCFESLCKLIEVEYGDLRLEWKYYNKKSGWLLKLFYKKRNVLFVIPRLGNFKVVFTFGERATETILTSDLASSIKDLLRAARNYAEGRSIQLEVVSESDCDQVVELIRFKLNS